MTMTTTTTNVNMVISATKTSVKRKMRHDFIDDAKEQVVSYTHPLGIKPLGNRYIDSHEKSFDPSYRLRSLGTFAILNDELIFSIFASLDAYLLAKLSAVSRVLRAFATHEEFWRSIVIDCLGGDFQWKGTWRDTFWAYKNSFHTTTLECRMTHFYSDTLFQSYMCSSLNLDPYCSGTETIERCHAPSLDEFLSNYANKLKPVILTGVITKWPAYAKWSKDYLLEKYGDRNFRAEAIDITLRDYFKYAQHNHDESPLYLFDKGFADETDLGNDYSVPIYFREDYFGVFEQRPNYRWLIIGPKHSGSTFHKDPNATSAWNAVISGSKRWIMFPPGTLPPGVFTNADESEVTAPVSINEWFYHYYNEARKLPNPPLEGTCHAGEVLFVPSGWWHLVLNTDFSIAITQNYVGNHNLANVFAFFRDKPSQITGFAEDDDDVQNVIGESIYSRFVSLMEKQYMNETQMAMKIINESASSSRSIWSQLKDGGSQEIFSFDFD